MLTPEQKRLVQESFEQLKPVAHAAGRLFYVRLFDLDPNLSYMFKNDLDEQSKKLMQLIALAVKGLDKPEELLPAVEALGRRHLSYGVQERHYATVGSALLWTLDKGLGAAFTPEVKEAWRTVYELLADTMKAAATPVAA
jgi:hemoglobin-like flavoprotein